ncbi:MAG: hypothetical protein KJ687_07545 [Proteobacteria bacterium]|nr:hypothetical protein [Pseudomonadota bacterium]
MPLRENPFHQIYITEILQPEEFTLLFSPILISNALALFQPGNVFIEGLQGSGKSMLLSLLKPEIRIAYHKKELDFPIPKEYKYFLSGGINLIRSGAIDFGQRLGGSQQIPPERLIRYFGDFVNYWIINDLFLSLETLDKYSDGILLREMGIQYHIGAIGSFIEVLKSKECWFGYLDSVSNYEEFKLRMRNRMMQYRRFLEGHIDDIDKETSDTTTNPGEPISQTLRSLWESDVLPPKVPVFIRIDQCETMARLEAKAEEQNLNYQFRTTINKMLGSRDPSVSYKLGGRKYSFRRQEESRMLGTTETIEDFRNYITIDLDDILRRQENRKIWLFPQFAEDVFRRRLTRAGYTVPDTEKDIISQVMGGQQLTTREKIEKYAGKNQRDIINLDHDWATSVKECLLSVADHDVLSAKLGEAWVRQQYERKNPDLPSDGYSPWDNKKWWLKERMFMALLQIAAKRAQKIIWARKNDILNLSGGNILMFLSMLEHIWAAWLRTLPRDIDWEDETIPFIDDVYVQSAGIEEASDRWYDKIKEDLNGDSRRRFVAFLGLLFRNRLRSDKKMSYPGHNGISLTINDLESNPAVYNILRDASAFGVMVDLKHTPKTPSRGESRKWYIHPIFAPHFQIPATHTKEPMYVSAKLVYSWLVKAKILYDEHETQST